ncbi:hypothetical protein [Muribaculum sp. NM65_B17]|uniref:hypothetical protein n=1 Tax=Bacteroidales TaxID=171549 RepID=UPI001093907B|nr:hypothetical protein [Muribaculum sp. NM65_B17]TGY01938.1 hypothetical protein E5354_13560 [Muribaculum sp. NM65_B17]THG41180.1 hypothetical protein E5985_12305 [Muribaculaceae bacterium]
MAKLEYDELVQLLQDGTIGFLRFMLESDNAESYLEWCGLHGIEPSEESAEFYYDETEIDMLERQLIDDKDYGIWN